MARFEDYQSWQAAVDAATARAWQRAGEDHVRFDATAETGVSHVIHDDDGESWEVREARRDCFHRIMDYLFADGPNPVKVLRRLYVIARCAAPAHLKHMNQSDVSVLCNETRAATSAREEKFWSRWLGGFGFFGTKRPLQKSAAACAAYKAAQQNNHNRHGGAAAARKYSALRTPTDRLKAELQNKKSA